MQQTSLINLNLNNTDMQAKTLISLLQENPELYVKIVEAKKHEDNAPTMPVYCVEKTVLEDSDGEEVFLIWSEPNPETVVQIPIDKIVDTLVLKDVERHLIVADEGKYEYGYHEKDVLKLVQALTQAYEQQLVIISAQIPNKKT